MTKFKVWSVLFGVAVGVAGASGLTLTRADDDWANLARYRAANAELPMPAAGVARVVFFGDSITDFWITVSPGFFQGKPFVDRGIAGQTSPQMRVRFQQDVVALRPKAVLILAGINDILRIADESSDVAVEDNIRSMVAIARAAGITPILCSLLPTSKVSVRERVKAVNAWLAGYARDHQLAFVDYFAAMADAHGDMPADLSADGLHPNLKGYAIMQPRALAAIATVGGVSP